LAKQPLAALAMDPANPKRSFDVGKKLGVQSMSDVG